MKILDKSFYQRDAITVAKDLLGKVIFHKVDSVWLSAKIIETEAYMRTEKASHSSLGFTQKRKALFMEPGTIYMYYARAKDSFNISVGNEGDAVLIKSAVLYPENPSQEILKKFDQLNPNRKTDKLFSGQTILCKSLDLKVTEWDQKQFDKTKLYIADVGYTATKILETPRLGIPLGRDEHLLYRFLDSKYAHSSTKKPQATYYI